MKEKENEDLTTQKPTVGQKNEGPKTSNNTSSKGPGQKVRENEKQEKEIDEREHQHEHKTPEGTEGNGNLRNEKEGKDIPVPNEIKKPLDQVTENPLTTEYRGL